MDVSGAKKLVKKSSGSNPNSGGQTVGLMTRKVVLEFEDIIKIEINYHRSQIKNLIIAEALMDLALEEILKN